MRIYLIGLALLYGLFLWWYGGSTTPLTAEELAHYETVIEGRNNADATKVFTLLTKSEDDGKEFYMQNLIRFREVATYPADSPFAGETDALAADARYAEMIVPLLLKRAGHPVFVGEPNGEFINDVPDARPWDQVALVRYRSRRDMLEMIIDPDMLVAAPHKFASIEETHVFPVSANINPFNMRAFVTGLFLILALIPPALRRR